MKKFRDWPKRTGSRIKKYRNSNQLCGPANRNTVTIENCNGTQLANAADKQAHAIKTPAKTRAGRRVTGFSRAARHATSSICDERSKVTPSLVLPNRND